MDVHSFFTAAGQILLGRLEGPLTLRLILQPTMAAFFALRAGMKDAREGRPAYLWHIFSNPECRRELLRNGWKDIRTVFILAVLLDSVYQALVFHWVFPGQAVLVAMILAIVPYILVRGPVTRILRLVIEGIKKRVLKAGLLVLTFGLFSIGTTAASDTYIAPEFDLYVTHSKIFRSHFIVSGNWLTSESDFSSAWYQYDLDISAAPFFQKYLFRTPDADKYKRFSFRTGYLQVSDLKDDPNGFDEKRPFGEFIYRIPAGRVWLMEDRNRGEYRMYTHGNDFWRYRNRLRIERSALVNKVKLTPYASGELFYTGHDQWNEFQTAIGVDVPWHQTMVWEFECMTQFVDSNLNTLSFGIMLQKFITWTGTGS